jgi:hypothetical protein
LNSLLATHQCAELSILILGMLGTCPIEVTDSTASELNFAPEIKGKPAWDDKCLLWTAILKISSADQGRLHNLIPIWLVLHSKHILCLNSFLSAVENITNLVYLLYFPAALQNGRISLLSACCSALAH